MFSEEQKIQILDMCSNQTKYGSKKELLEAIRDYLVKSSYNDTKNNANIKAEKGFISRK